MVRSDPVAFGASSADGDGTGGRLRSCSCHSTLPIPRGPELATASTPIERARRALTPAIVGSTVAAVLATALLARELGLGETAVAPTFVIIFTAIFTEALPFVLLGAVAAAVVEVYVSDSAFARLARLPIGLQLPAAALGGFAFPVCECGSVPVARRLIRRGLHPSAAIAFMLASPIFNPIVLASTYIAYEARLLGPQMVSARAVLGFVVAVVIAWALGSEGARELLRARPDDGRPAMDPSAHRDAAGKRIAFLEHLTADLFFMGKFLVVGAAISALMQTVLPQSLIAGIASTPLAAALALMAVAYVSSLCSEADAFVAVSFTQFSLGSQLAFLAFGPILDLKLTFLYSATFRRRFALRLAFVAVPVILAGSLWMDVVVGTPGY
ncbi:MAG: permease [Actinomycetota bacterium]|nr:permease [Actinomycetota bacterium]